MRSCEILITTHHAPRPADRIRRPDFGKPTRRHRLSPSACTILSRHVIPTMDTCVRISGPLTIKDRALDRGVTFHPVKCFAGENTTSLVISTARRQTKPRIAPRSGEMMSSGSIDPEHDSIGNPWHGMSKLSAAVAARKCPSDAHSAYRDVSVECLSRSTGPVVGCLRRHV